MNILNKKNPLYFLHHFFHPYSFFFKVGYSGNPRQNPRQAPYVEKPVTDEPPLLDTEEARLNGQSLRRFVRNAVTNEMRQREATLEGKVRERRNYFF